MSRSGEFDLIKKLIDRLPDAGKRVRIGPGDDAAVVEPPGGGAASVTTVDALVEGVHFKLPEFPPAAIGRKALAAGLSDLAAMGAEAGEAYVVLGLPEGMDETFVLELHEGLTELASSSGVELLGGDVNRAAVLVLSVTAVGHEPEGSNLVSRAGAAAGETLVVTGELGGAAAALKLLGGDAEAEQPLAEALLARQLAPQPRLDAGRALAAVGATAMIDISDGLGADAGHLAAASRVRIEIEIERIPVQEGVAEVAGSSEAALELAAAGGEDYELLASIPSNRVAEAAAALEPLPLTEIGSVKEGSGVSLLTPDGRELEPRGFEHF